MSTSGKSRFKKLFKRSSSSPSTPPPSQPLQEPFPPAFHCPITKFPMAEPVVIPTGESLDRMSIEACRELNFTPPELSSLSIDFSSPSLLLIPNLALKSAIRDWCDSGGIEHPRPFSLQMAKGYVETAISSGIQHCDSHGVNKEPSFRAWLVSTTGSIAAGLLGSRISGRDEKQPSPSPADRISVVDLFMKEILMELKKTPIALNEPSRQGGGNQESSSVPRFASSADNRPPSSPCSLTRSEKKLEKKILKKFKKSRISERESALANLIQLITEESPDYYRVSLCTPRIMSVLIAMLQESPNDSISVSAVEAIYTFSLSPTNRTKIVEWGAVPALVHFHKEGIIEARGKAASTIYNLSINEENRMAIGASGAISSLFDRFYISNYACREEAGLALCYLVLCSHNLDIFANLRIYIRLLKVAVCKSESVEEGEIELRKIALILMYHLLRSSYGRKDLMDSGVGIDMLKMVRKGEGIEVYCLAVLYNICLHDLSGFRRFVIEARAEKVFAEMKEAWGEDGRELAQRMLEIIRGEYKKKKPIR